MLLTGSHAFAHDFEVQNSDGVTIYYNITSSTDLTCEVTFRGSDSSSYSDVYKGNITIPNTVTYYGTTYSVTSIGDHAFSSCHGLTSITIPNSVTSIDNYAFIECTGLTSIEIPKNVTRIGSQAFYHCTGLTHIVIGNSVTEIEFATFYDCTSLISVAIPNSVTSIGERAFQNCTSLTYIELPSTITSISNYAFYNYYNYISRTIVCNATTPPTLGDNVFSYNYLTLEVPFASVHTYKAVEGWIKNSSGNITYKPKEVDGIYYLSISETEVEVTYKDTNYNSYSGEVTIPSEITVDEKKYKVTSIGSSAFRDCFRLNNVTIPEGVDLIGDYAFYKCYDLMDFIIPSTVTKIGENAFAFDYDRYMASDFGYCSVDRNVKCNAVNPPAVALNAFDYCNLTIEVSFESVFGYKAVDGWLKTNYGYKAYKGKEVEGLYYLPISENEVEVTYKDSNYNSYTGDIVIPTEIIANEKTYKVSTIGNSAFRDCSGLTSVTIPNSVTNIGNYAFNGCSGLTSVLELPSGIESIGTYGFSTTNYNVCRIDATIPPVVTSNSLPSSISLVLVPTGGKAAYTADAVWGTYTIIEEGSCDIEVTNGLAGELTKSIFEQTRKNLPNITSLIVHGTLNANDLEKINTSMTSLLHLDISDTDLTEIVAEAFLNKATLMSVKLPKALKSIGNSAFRGCGVLSEEFKIPETIEVIGNNAFENCIALNGVLIIPASVNSIGSSAFSGCRGINTIDMSKASGLTSMQDNAFYNCSGLKKVDMSGVTELVALEQYMFSGCVSLKDINLSNTLKIVKDYAFNGCRELENVHFPASLQSIGNYAFQNCSKIMDLNFDGCEYLVSIGTYAFSNCIGLETLSFAECSSLTSFSSNIFSGCTSLKEVDMLGCTSITAVSDYMFSGCTSLQAVKLPSSMITLGSYVFNNCTGLEVVNLEGCKKLSNIYNTAFNGCTGLKLLDITECTSLRTINDNTFSTCTALETVNFPSSLTSIGASAFANCTNLLHMSVPCTTPPAIANNANPFEGVDNIACVLSIPSDNLFDYYEANYWGGFVDIENKSDIQIEVTETENESVETSRPSCKIYFKKYVEEIKAPAALSLNNVKANLNEETVTTEIGKAVTASGQSVFVGNGEAITFYFTLDEGKEIDKVLYNNKDVTQELVDNTFTTPAVNTVSTLQVIMKKSDLTGVEDAFIEEVEEVEVARYDINGRLLSSPIKGVNIVKMSDGSIKKVIVK